MKKIIFLLSIFIGLIGNGLFSDTQNLADKLFNYIENYFQNEKEVKISITKFENTSGMSDFAAQRLYQIIVSRFEKNQKYKFKDLLADFDQNQGEFNIHNTQDIDYYLYLRLIRNKTNIGMGLGIFSYNLNRIENIKYFEEKISPQEIEVLNIRRMGFDKVGFYKIAEIETKKHLMDIAFLKDFKGKNAYLLFYPDKIDIFNINNNQFNLMSSIKLDWERPFYTVKEYEGKITLFNSQNIQYISIGGNFSPKAKIFHVQDSNIIEDESLDFVPLELINMNNKFYIVGAKYEEGTNYFKGFIYLKPFGTDEDDIFSKTVKGFYSISFIKEDDKLLSFYLVDRDYNLISYMSDFEEQNIFENKTGTALSNISRKWVIFSDFSNNQDRIFFADIHDGGFKVDFNQEILGDIMFLSPGEWEGMDGIWAQVRYENKLNPYRLVFFGKK